MQSYFFLILYVALIFQDFKYAEFSYHFCLETGFKRNEEAISAAQKWVLAVWSENCSNWWMYSKKSLVAIFHMLSRFLPESVQAFTEPFFKGILSKYETALQQSQATESTTDLSDVPSGTEYIDTPRPTTEVR